MRRRRRKRKRTKRKRRRGRRVSGPSQTPSQTCMGRSIPVDYRYITPPSMYDSVTGILLEIRLLCPRPVGGALSGHRRPSSVCLMSRTSALTRKPKGLGRRNFAQGYLRSHATPTPTSRSKGQKSRSRDGGILWRPPSRTACLT